MGIFKHSKQNNQTENHNQLIGTDVKRYVYKIIIGSYQTITSANQHLKAIRKLFPDAYVVKVEIK